MGKLSSIPGLRTSVFEVSLSSDSVRVQALFDTGGLMRRSQISLDCFERLKRDHRFVFQVLENSGSRVQQSGGIYSPSDTISTTLLLMGCDPKKPAKSRIARSRIVLDVMPTQGMMFDLHIGLADLERLHIMSDPHNGCARFRTTPASDLHFPELDKYAKSFAVEEEVSRRRQWNVLLEAARGRLESDSLRLKDAKKVSDLSEATLLALKQSGRLPVDTEAGVLYFGRRYQWSRQEVDRRSNQ